MSDMVYAAWTAGLWGGSNSSPNMDGYDQSWSNDSLIDQVSPLQLGDVLLCPLWATLSGYRFSSRPDESCVRSSRSVCDEARKRAGMIKTFSRRVLSLFQQISTITESDQILQSAVPILLSSPKIDLLEPGWAALALRALNWPWPRDPRDWEPRAVGGWPHQIHSDSIQSPPLFTFHIFSVALLGDTSAKFLKLFAEVQDDRQEDVGKSDPSAPLQGGFLRINVENSVGLPRSNSLQGLAEDILRKVEKKARML